MHWVGTKAVTVGGGGGVVGTGGYKGGKVVQLWTQECEVGPCLVHSKMQKVFKISRHIAYAGTCM
jgi:hypothetical protein